MIEKTNRRGSWVTLGRGCAVALAVVALLAGGTAGAARPHPKAPPAAAEGVVNINTATEGQLELLPGIGPSKARAVVRYRERRKFKAPHELIRVRGIGRKTFRKLRPYLTVSGPTTLTARPRPVKQQP